MLTPWLTLDHPQVYSTPSHTCSLYASSDRICNIQLGPQHPQIELCSGNTTSTTTTVTSTLTSTSPTSTTMTPTCTTPPPSAGATWYCRGPADSLSCSLSCSPGHSPTGVSEAVCQGGSFSPSLPSLPCSPAAVLLAGGSLLSPYRVDAASTAELYSPGRNCSPLPSLPSPRAEAAMVRGPSGEVLLCGGTGPSTSPGAHTDCLQLDRNGSWVHHSLLTTERVGGALVRAGGQLFMVGGVEARQGSEHWGGGGQWEAGGASLPLGVRSVYGHCLLPYNGDSFLLLGGLREQTGYSTSAGVDMYNTTTGQWTQWPDMRRARRNQACAWVEGGLLVAGGVGEEEGTATTAEFLDMALNTWVEVGEMTFSREGGQMAVLGGDGEVAYMLGGYSRREGSYWDSVERYSGEGGWGQQGGMREERAGHAAVLVPEDWCHLL